VIAIPHGLAAEVLRALQDGPRTTGQIVDAIDQARGRGEEEPGVGLAPVWQAVQGLRIGFLTFRLVTPTRVAWELRR
jgi:hypothetical protein